VKTLHTEGCSALQGALVVPGCCTCGGVVVITRQEALERHPPAKSPAERLRTALQGVE
jgi:hypothetical protein